jgi:hypothetical protein
MLLFATLGNGLERGIYLTFGDTCVINSIRKPFCVTNVPGAPRGKAQNKRPACALSAIFWRVGPSTRGATAPQRAQQVNFVRRSDLSYVSIIVSPRRAKQCEHHDL